ncbi:MAG: phosphomannomutase/phosphoglucomutase [Pseudomonadota bacterium]|nr:phosphomannomutase/phosphoglucomutase [Pseudomonadota bacterium]MEC7831334.1 phosphomannomutase/phosphoglucomutase [Pseudomonadota bacterium]MEC9414679.1 phosphomannomutase/phosphoglucomutase [Pseudomonadota bacterium]MEC9481515.1 phosphomannomutase/phosphoglucomutase [Pseudomonadota bacterium]
MDINYSHPVNFSLQDYKEEERIYDLGFREYDARWIYPEQINLSGIQKIGLSLGNLIQKTDNNKKITVGHDFRSYSEEIKEALIGGLIASGIDVYDIGLTISPCAYFSQYLLDCDNVAMVTASHNPNGWTGIKMGDQKTLTFGPEKITQLKEFVSYSEYPDREPGKYVFKNINNTYIDDLTSKVEIKRKIKTVVACGNGTAGIFAPLALNKIGAEVIPLHCELDSTFPNYNPNPEDMEMLSDLGKHVIKNNADIGFAFDGDGDRVGIVDNKGREIFSDKAGLLIARNLSNYHKNKKIIIDVKSTSLFLTDEILQKNNSEIIFWKTGHSYIKRKTYETDAIAGFERSGHFFFNNPIGRGYDDGIISAIEVIKILNDNKNKSIAELYDELPVTYSSPTMSPKCPEEDKYEIVEKIKIILQEKKDNKELIAGQNILSLLTVNGIRIILEDGSWGLIRASSNSPNLVVVCESPISLERMKEIFYSLNDILTKFPEIGEYDQKI